LAAGKDLHLGHFDGVPSGTMPERAVARPPEFMDEGKGDIMTKGLVTYLVLGAVGLVASGRCCAEELKTEKGRLQTLVAQLASSDYVIDEAVRDDRPYVEPTTKILHAFRHLAAAMAWGDVKDAARQADKLDYELVEFTDTHTKHEYYVLRENRERVEPIRGWGSYIINPNSRIDALVEVPHPIADAQTPEIGGLVFENAEAKGFLLAGAHREKADVPDLVESIFHQVHTAWIGPLAQMTAWQIHGFAGFKHAFPRGAEVVASTGDGEIVPELRSLDALLEDRGLTSYVFNDREADSRVNKRLNKGVPGVTFTSLAATQNEQGRLSRSLGGAFVHVELETSIRNKEDTREVAASVIASAMAGAPERADDAGPDVLLTSLENETTGEARLPNDREGASGGAAQLADRGGESVVTRDHPELADGETDKEIVR
jgi:hypothetical protein